jgi:sigma-B regulation protein RsbU (phosphoserine phosphatase)
MAARMVSNTPSRHRSLLYLAAALFAVATAFYSIVWVYYAPQAGLTSIGAEFTYSLPARVLKVMRVLQGSIAQQAGLLPGDEILAINGKKLEKLTPFYELVVRGRPGNTVEFSVQRPGEESPRIVPVVLESRLQSIELYRLLTPSRIIVLQIMRSYPIAFLVVGLSVLFLKVGDPNAWLLALFFAGFIAAPDIPPGVYPSTLRGFMVVFHVVLGGLAPAVLYSFLAVFPAPSPLEQRAPWLKWAFLSLGGILTAASLWTMATANVYETVWIPLDYGGPAWLGPLIRAPGYFYNLGGEGLALASLIGNSFRAVTPEAQRKARVIVWGIACGLLPFILLVLVLSLTGRRFQEIPFWPYALCVLSMFLIPLSFAYAVVVHRVMEIPVLLKRSARYLLVQRGFVLMILLVSWGASAAFVLAFARLLKSSPQVALSLGLGGGVALGGLLTWGGSEAAKRGTRRIDRAFFRNAYDARVILEELGEQVRAAKDRQSLSAMLEQQITSALRPQSMVIFFEAKPGRLVAQATNSPPGLEVIPTDAPALAELARRGKPWEVRATLGDNGGGLPGFPGVKAECLVPVLGRGGRPIGLIGLGPRLSEEAYSGEDKRLLASVASQAGIALENLQLAEQMAERIEAEQRTAREMEIAREVQARLFPQKLPPLATLDYCGRCVQARQVGGDYYDFLDLGPGRLGLLVADIAGKGISGALLMANLQANLRSQYAVALDDPSRLLRSVNQLFFENTAESSYATLFFADYDDTLRRLRYANCGHNPPALIRSGGGVERLSATTTVLGLFQNWECPIKEQTLQPGDTLVLYSDGLTEARSDEGEEFGDSRLIETILKCRQLSALELLNRLLGTLQRFRSSEQEDDITLVIARCIS